MRKRYDGIMTSTSQPVIYARCGPELHDYIAMRAKAQGVSMGEAVRRIVQLAKAEDDWCAAAEADWSAAADADSR
jgi:predicted HicB family RNase H-like nuclease